MITDFKDLHKGETCIVIGNGPSLRSLLYPRHSLFLYQYPSFGSNRIYLSFTPHYYVCVNPLVIEQNRSDIPYIHSNKFIRAGMIKDANQLNCNGPHKFSFEPDRWVYEGYTVTFVSLELAYYMGFSTVLLVGVDHRYEYDGHPNEAHRMNSDDPNHFDPKYFKGQIWNNPDLVRSEQAYRMAKEAYENDGRRIINLTPDSALDVFEKGDLRDWIR